MCARAANIMFEMSKEAAKVVLCASVAKSFYMVQCARGCTRISIRMTFARIPWNITTFQWGGAAAIVLRVYLYYTETNNIT